MRQSTLLRWPKLTERRDPQSPRRKFQKSSTTSPNQEKAAIPNHARGKSRADSKKKTIRGTITDANEGPSLI